MVSDKS